MLMALLVALAVAQEPPAEPPATKPADGEERPRKLDLGPYGAPAGGTPKVETLTDAPRFESTIDVEGRAPVDFNQAMSVWWAHFNFTSAAVYGRGTAFRAAPPQGSVDVTPLVNWVADKVSDYKRNRRKPPIPLASPFPGASRRPRPRRPRLPSPDDRAGCVRRATRSPRCSWAEPPTSATHASAPG